jgi:cobalt/nickel transport system permease protein
MRSLGLPAILADMLLLSYRYLFEIAGNLAQMQRSMRLRGFQSRGHRWLVPNWQDLNRLASLAGTLFIRSYEQAERIYQAMRLRGYGTQTRPIAPTHRAKTQSNPVWSGVGLAIALIVALSFAVAEVGV